MTLTTQLICLLCNTPNLSCTSAPHKNWTATQWGENQINAMWAGCILLVYSECLRYMPPSCSPFGYHTLCLALYGAGRVRIGLVEWGENIYLLWHPIIQASSSRDAQGLALAGFSIRLWRWLYSLNCCSSLQRIMNFYFCGKALFSFDLYKIGAQLWMRMQLVCMGKSPGSSMN